MLPAQKHSLETLFKAAVSQVVKTAENAVANAAASVTQNAAKSALENAAKSAAGHATEARFAEPPIVLERPKSATHGDVACNVAMQLAKPLRTNPRQLAQQIVAALVAQPAADGLIGAAEVAGPGFINLRLTNQAKLAVIGAVLAEGGRFGHSSRSPDSPDTPRSPDSAHSPDLPHSPESPHLAHSSRSSHLSRAPVPRVLVEFVSANPTGPLHVGHGRQAALGDALSNVLASQGYAVHREFYYNDAGAQIHNLAVSTQARARGLKPGDAHWPEAAYNGEYVADIARDYLARKTVAAKDGEPVQGLGDVENLDAIRRFAVACLRHEQDQDLQAFGVKFDQYYLESSLYSDGRVEKTVAALVAAGKTYEQDGALWLRTTEDGDDKDRVMRKSDGTYTYFVPDVAYHVTKWERGFTRVIDVQGSDHHGTIARVRAGLQGLGLGIPQGYPDYVLHKMVTVMRNGQEVKISKRAGSYVTVRDLIEWSGGMAPEREGANGTPSLANASVSTNTFTLTDTVVPTDAPLLADTAVPTNASVPANAPTLANASVPTDVPTLADAAVPTDAPSLADASVPANASVPTNASTLADAVVPTDASTLDRQSGRTAPEPFGKTAPELGPGSDATPARPDAALIQRGRDAVRFFLISRKADTEFVFDIDLALKRNDENPVYYVQYAHARISSILAEWQSRYGGDVAVLPQLAAECALASPDSPLAGERALALAAKLAEFPDVLAHAAAELAPHMVAFYLRELAAGFHSFYNAERVLVDDARERDARVALLAATRQVLANGLAIIGVSAPQRM